MTKPAISEHRSSTKQRETSYEQGLLHFRLLGSPIVKWNGEPITISRRQTQALLFRLAEARDPLPRDQLALLFWPDTDDRKAHRRFSRLLSAVRQELPRPEFLLTSRDEASLDQERVTIDCQRFVELSQSNEPMTLEGAVAMYRGEFLNGFSLDNCHAFERWLFYARQHYEQLYLKALDDLIDIKKAAGDYQAAVQYALRYLAVDDLTERIHRQLVELYALSGDRIAAQRQYEQCVTILERELGVAPLPETRAVYEAVMRKTSLSESKKRGLRPSWTTLPSLELPLTGREEAWQQLTNAYKRFKSGGVVLIVGEPGIGKSRLLQDFSAHLEQCVLTANSHASTQNLPYQPIVLALRQALSQPELWSSIRPIWLAELERILPEIRDYFKELPRPFQVEPIQAQARLYEAISQVLLGLARGAGSMVLCLDDIHWADEATLGWLNFIGSRLEQTNLCLLAICRSENVEKLTSIRRTLQRAGYHLEIKLNGLSIEAVAKIIKQLPTSNPGALAARLQQSTKGNPFFVLETLRALVESDQIASPPDELPLPNTVKEVVRGRLHRLTLVARQVLEAAAVLSPNITYELLHTTTGRSEPELVDGLDELNARQLIIPAEELFQFQHELVRAFIYDELSPWRRQKLHHRAADALAQVHRDKLDQVAAQTAYHFEQAGQTKDAIFHFHLAAKVARGQYANQEAIEFLNKAIGILPEPTTDWAQVTQLYESLADNLVDRGRYSEAEKSYRDALDLLPTGKRNWRSRLYSKLAPTLIHQGRAVETESLFREALLTLGPHLKGATDKTLWQSWLSIQLSRFEALYYQARLDEMEDLTKEIEPILAEHGTTSHRLAHIKVMLMYMLRRERYRLTLQHIAYAQQGVGLARVLGERALLSFHKFSLGFALICAGELDSAADELFQSLEIAESVDFLPGKNLCLIYLMIVWRLKGDIDQVRYYMTQSQRKALQVGVPVYIGAVTANQAWLHYRDGNWESAEASAQKALRQMEGANYPFHWLALWPSLAISVSRNDLASAIESAASMLDPIQQRLPNNLTALLKSAIDHWQDNDHDATRKTLFEAVKIAHTTNYL